MILFQEAMFEISSHRREAKIKRVCGSQCGLPAAAVDRDTWQPSSTSNPKHLKPLFPLFLTFSFLSAFNVTKQLVKSGNIIHTLRLSDRTFDFNTLCDPDPHPSDKASVLDG